MGFRPREQYEALQEARQGSSRPARVVEARWPAATPVGLSEEPGFRALSRHHRTPRTPEVTDVSEGKLQSLSSREDKCLPVVGRCCSHARKEE